MLFTCLFLLPHANFALNYTCWQVQLPKWRCPWDRCAYFRFPSRCVLADIGTLEMLVYNLKLIGNFVNLNMSFTVADIINCQLYWNESYIGNRSLTLWTRTQFSPTKSLLSTYLTCHSSAIYTCKATWLPCMLFTCLFLLQQANYALNYTCVDKSYFKMALPKLYSTLHAEIWYLLPVSHRLSFGGYGH